MNGECKAVRKSTHFDEVISRLSSIEIRQNELVNRALSKSEKIKYNPDRPVARTISQKGDTCVEDPAKSIIELIEIVMQRMYENNILLESVVFDLEDAIP